MTSSTVTSGSVASRLGAGELVGQMECSTRIGSPVPRERVCAVACQIESSRFSAKGCCPGFRATYDRRRCALSSPASLLTVSSPRLRGGFKTSGARSSSTATAIHAAIADGPHGIPIGNSVPRSASNWITNGRSRVFRSATTSISGTSLRPAVRATSSRGRCRRAASSGS